MPTVVIQAGLQLSFGWFTTPQPNGPGEVILLRHTIPRPAGLADPSGPLGHLWGVVVHERRHLGPDDSR
eukprot:4478641-Alexandrium_andersonii.AAC.1